MIYFDKVSKIYPNECVALDCVSFGVEPREFLSIVGPSGAGKTTLLKMILAEEKPTEGKVLFKEVGKGELGVQGPKKEKRTSPGKGQVRGEEHKGLAKKNRVKR